MAWHPTKVLYGAESRAKRRRLKKGRRRLRFDRALSRYALKARRRREADAFRGRARRGAGS